MEVSNFHLIPDMAPKTEEWNTMQVKDPQIEQRRFATVCNILQHFSWGSQYRKVKKKYIYIPEDTGQHDVG